MKTISKSDYYKTIGLLTLAKSHHDKLLDIEDSLCEILDEEKDSSGYSGHIGDSIWSEQYSADELLKKLEIKVED